MLNKRNKKELIFPGLIILLSIINFPNYIEVNNYIAIFVTFIGVIGVVLFLTNKGKASLMFKIWLYSQFPSIYVENIEQLENGLQMITTTNVFNVEQLLSFNFGIGLELSNGNKLNLGFYLIPFLYLGIYKISIASIFINKQIIALPINKAKTQFRNEFPIKGVIVKRVEINKETNWLLIKCEKELIYKDIVTSNILIKPKEETLFKKNKVKIAYVRLVQNNNEIPDIITNKKDYPFFEWFKVKVTN